MLIQIIMIQSFTSFSQKAAEIFDLENSYFFFASQTERFVESSENCRNWILRRHNW